MSEQYLGRIVAIGRNKAGACAAMYRVSSRSFPNRRAVPTDRGAAIVPKEGCEADVFKNPYIAYNCCALVGDWALVTNGAHTDPVAQKMADGMPVRDAMVLTLLAMDYEHDQLDTPRIAAAVARGADTGYLAIVRKDGLTVRELLLSPGTCRYVSTYEASEVKDEQRDAFEATGAEGCCDYVLGGGAFAGFLNPVTAVCACEGPEGFEVAMKDAPRG
jgi:IMP cyclohydrolase